MRNIKTYTTIFLSLIILIISILIPKNNADFIQDDIDLIQIEKDIQCIVNRSSLSFDVLLKSDNPWQESHLNSYDYALYKDKELKYWTSNKVDYEELIRIDKFGIYRLSSRIYFVFFKQYKEKKVYGFIPLRKDFELDNNFLKNQMFSAINLPENYKPVKKETNYFVQVHYQKNNYRIYFDKLSENKLNPVWFFLIMTLFFLSLFSLSFAFISLLNKRLGKYLIIKITIILTYLVTIRFFLLQENIIPFSQQFALFKPFGFANNWIPSLAMLMVNVVWVSCVCFVIVRCLRTCKPIRNTFLISFLHILSLVGFVFTIVFIKDVIFNSTSSFVTFDSVLLRYQDVLLLICFGLLIFVNLRLLNILINRSINVSFFTSLKKLLLLYLPVFIFLLSLNFYLIYSILWFSLSTLLFILCKKGKVRKSNRDFILLLISATFLVLYIARFSEQKEESRRLLHLNNYETQNNRQSEYLIGNLDKKLNQDTVLVKLIQDLPHTIQPIYDYITRQYLSGYWFQFQSDIVICGSEDILAPPNDINSCHNFFSRKLNQTNKSIENSQFISIHNYGLEYFLGQYHYTINSDSSLVDLYIYLKPKEQYENLGYPSILLSQDIDKVFNNSHYSFAKYVDGILVNRQGDYIYPTESIFSKLDGERQKLHKGKYVHLIQKYNDNSYNVISWKKRSIWSFFIALSYVFILFSVVFYSGKYIAILFGYQYSDDNTLKDKLRLAFIGILTITFVVLAIVIISRSAKLSERKQISVLKEKMQSIVVEFKHKVEEAGGLDNMKDNSLNYYLAKFSNVFFTDINLFDLKGKLIESSRPEVFEKNLVGKRMNSVAFNEIDIKKLSAFIHTEQIGTQKYLSAYMPFRDEANHVIAYLNLPYFAKNDQVQKDLSDIVMALLNLFVFLFLLTSVFTIFISNRITRPLSIIQQKLRGFRVEKKNEEINYHSNDEIGSLVKEYNRAVRELNESIALLSQKEREGAWKEMAKQIAHEIKNPLTPMKLSLQHLKYIWKQDAEDKKERTENTIDLVVQQIDRLAETASAFADFSKMTEAIPQVFELKKLIKEQTELFLQEAEICLDAPQEEYFVFADEHQTSRVFQNILSNAIEAAKEDDKLKIDILLKQERNNVYVSVIDNGSGMDEGTQNHLFEPYFTTKSSGTGLGLSIVKQIVENNNGEITFVSEKDKGTRFDITLPIK